MKPVATDPLQAWLPTPGTDLYYAFRYVPAAAALPLILLESFRRLLANIPLGCSNPEIARAKLDWWHGELHTPGNASSRHALLRALEPFCQRDAALKDALFALVEGTRSLLDQARFEDPSARWAAYTKTHSPLWAVHARSCGITNPTRIAAVCELGLAIELIWGFRELRRLIDAQVTWLCQTHIPVAATSMADGDWYAAVGTQEIIYLRATIKNAEKNLRAGGTLPRACRGILVLAELARTTLEEIATDGCRVWERRIELTPLRKLLRTLKVRFRD